MSSKTNLEKSLADLETLVEELEAGDLPLEDAMKKFEKGIKLTRNAQAALKDAEQKVEILLKSAGGDEALEDFDADSAPGRPRLVPVRNLPSAFRQRSSKHSECADPS